MKEISNRGTNPGFDPGWPILYRRLLLAAISAWTVLVAAELVLLFGVLPLFGILVGADLLPSLKVVLDMVALTACGWIAGRIGRPRAIAATVLVGSGLALWNLEPYIPLNVPWLLRLTGNAIGDSRYISSLLTSLTLHVLMFGSLFTGARLSRPGDQPIRLRFER